MALNDIKILQEQADGSLKETPLTLPIIDGYNELTDSISSVESQIIPPLIATAVRTNETDVDLYLGNSTAFGANVSVADRHLLLVPVLVHRAVGFRRFAIRLGSTAPTTSGVIRMALYAPNASGLPSSPIDETVMERTFTPQDAVSSVYVVNSEADVNSGAYVVPRGLYWIGVLNVSGATLSFSSSTPSNAWLLNQIVGSNTVLTGSNPEALTSFVTVASGNNFPNLDGRTFQQSINTASSTTLRYRVSAPAVFMGYWLPYVIQPGGPQ